MSKQNEIIISVLTQMVKFKKGDQYRKRAYQNAIDAISNHPYEIRCGEDAQKIDGVGKSIGQKIDEILKTGTLKVLEERLVEEVEKERVTEMFEKIYGVGVRKAEQWYKQGYRSMEDLKEEVPNMTSAQQIGYKYYDDINQRIPRDEMDQFNELFKNIFLTYEIEYQICGSYRRGCSNSGDIDVLIKGNRGLKLKDLVESMDGFLIEKLSLGRKKYMGLCRLDENHPVRRIDILIVEPVSWGYALLYFTGSKKLNVQMRQRAIEMGMSLSEYELTDKEGNRYEAKSEEDIFDHLGMKYLKPEERNV